MHMGCKRMAYAALALQGAEVKENTTVILLPGAPRNSLPAACAVSGKAMANKCRRRWPAFAAVNKRPFGRSASLFCLSPALLKSVGVHRPAPPLFDLRRCAQPHRDGTHAEKYTHSRVRCRVTDYPNRRLLSVLRSETGASRRAVTLHVVSCLSPQPWPASHEAPWRSQRENTS